MDLEAQRDQLEALAEAQGVDLAPVNQLPDDPRLRILGLATLLGIDPMHVANEGKLVAFVAPDGA